MLTSAGKGASELSDVKGFIVGNGNLSSFKDGEQTREEKARKNPRLEKCFSGSAESGDFRSGL